MTPEERAELMEQLKAEVMEELRRRPTQPIVSAYAVASHYCDAYFEGIKQTGQDYGASMLCREAARRAFKEKHGIRGKANKTPNRYIGTEEAGAEYFELFKGFLAVYQSYLH